MAQVNMPIEINTLDHSLLNAVDLAFHLHEGQFDKCGEPYIYHVLRVGVSLLPDVEAAVCGVLHDSLEDTPVSVQTIEEKFGNRVVATLRLLTRPHDMNYEYYIKRLSGHSIASKVKLADLYDNLNTDRLRKAEAGGADIARLVAKYIHALKMLLQAA